MRSPEAEPKLRKRCLLILHTHNMSTLCLATDRLGMEILAGQRPITSSRDLAGTCKLGAASSSWRRQHRSKHASIRA